MVIPRKRVTRVCGKAAGKSMHDQFCTIEPNVGDVAVPDARLDKLAAIAAMQR